MRKPYLSLWVPLPDSTPDLKDRRIDEMIDKHDPHHWVDAQN
jgi:hypothetical protein